MRTNADPAASSTVSFTVTFSEFVTGVDRFDFSLAASGTIAGASIASVNGTGTTRIVAINSISGSGIIRLNLIGNDTIRDLLANRLGGTGTGNGNHTTGGFYTKN